MTDNGEETRVARRWNDERYAAEEDEEGFDTRRRRQPRGRPGGGGPPQRRGGFRRRRKVCSFCVDKVKVIDYKDVNTFRRFLDGHGKIQPSRKTGTCARHQRRLTVAIKRARHLALVPFTTSRTPYSE